jgi:hypothetical protein
MENEITTVVPDTQLIARADSGSIAMMIQQTIAGGITEQTVATTERLVGLLERMQAREAKVKYASAMAKVQAEMPKIYATRPVMSKSGALMYKYANEDDLIDAIGPILSRHGFSRSYSLEARADGIMTISVTLTHLAGHSETTPFPIRETAPSSAQNAQQADGSTVSYGRRYALCMILGIPICHDDDARPAGSGDKVTQEQADHLRKQVAALVKSKPGECAEALSEREDETHRRFLALAGEGVQVYEDIPVDVVSRLQRRIDEAAKKRGAE